MIRLPNRYRWLPLLVILMTGVMGFVALLGFWKLEDHLEDRTGRDLQWAAMEIAEKLDLLFLERYGDIQIIATLLPEVGDETKHIRWIQHLKKIQEAYPIYAWIGLSDKAGRIVAATDPDTIGKDAGSMAQARELDSKSAIMVSEVQHDDLLKGQQTVVFSIPVAIPPSSGGSVSFHGYMMTRIRFSELDAIVTRTLRELKTKTDFRQDLEYQVLNSRGQVIIESIHQTEGPVDLGSLDVESARLVTAGRTGFVLEEHRRRGVPVLTGYAPMSARKLGWGILVRTDREAALASVRSVLWSVVAWGVSLLLPLSGVFLWMTSQLQKEWRQAEVARQASKEAQELRQAIVDNAFDAHLLMDQEGVIVGWNHKAEELFGWPSQEAMGRRVGELIVPPGYRQTHEQGLKEFLETETGLLLNKRFEFEGWHREARAFPIELTITPLKQPFGFVFSAFVRDMTERVKQQRQQAAEYRIAKQLLEAVSLESASREIMRTICETLEWRLGILWKVDQDVRALRFAEAWMDGGGDFHSFLDLSRQTHFHLGSGLPGRVWESGKIEWLSNVTRDPNFPRASLAAEAGLHTGFALPIGLDGKTHAVLEFFASDVRELDGKLSDMLGNLVAQLAQFLRRKTAEAAITAAKASAEQAADEKTALLATVEAFFIRLTESGVVCEWTSQAEHLFGIPLLQIFGRSFCEASIDWDWEAIHHSVNRARTTLSTVHLDKVPFRKHKDQQRFLKLTISPLCKDIGVDVVIMGEDTTERLLLERDLSQAQKLESIGQLAAGIAHEINTPIQFVGDNIRFLSDVFADLCVVLERHRALLVAAKTGICPPDLIEACEAEAQRADLDYVTEEIPKAISQSAEGIARVAKIVRAMKAFAHPGSEEQAGVDLNQAIESTVTVAHNEWKYVADLTTDLARDLPLIPCFLGQFNQVILNMIVNAAHAISDVVKSTGQKGVISIMSSRVGDWAEIRITDTGSGIPDHILDKIFDPFFTTKEVGKGTGQGLAIARSVVVDKHHGTITVESQVGEGTTFIIRLPVQGSGERREMEERERAA